MNFQDELGLLQRGHFFDNLEDGMSDVLASVKRHRKAGSVTITITMGMEGSEDDQLNIKTKIAKKKPEADPVTTTMFIKDGRLTSKDPKQKDFGDIHTVVTEHGEIVDAPIFGESRAPAAG